MEMLTPNVYTETKIRGCNPSIVFTSEGSVFIDTAQWLSTLLEMREFAKKRGPIKYLINTEGHIDHIFGNHWFAGESLVIGHEKLNEIFWTVAGDISDCYDYSVDVLERQDKAALPLMPKREEFIVNRPQITFREHMTLHLGDTVFELYHTPGHSTSQLCVHVPKEHVAFVGDTLFSGCQTWLHSADIGALLQTLDFLETLDVDYFVPGHGSVVDRSYIAEQRAFVYEWLSAVGSGIARGWDMDTCVKNISFADRYPVDIGQEEMMEYIQRTNVIRCYKYLTNTK
ncbi:MBL fold metallo-hydrolase [Agathobaculum sp. NTUH-O15-33]|uniref:MBL fold metallo-hydrolase n=1 Tax=Agathobaculum sp. NTUH-O15-33 TaxID=3079302 RepID=UPI0029589853|nr:MBL fold metallo-hydrolase [Agathobaculum sp. NTUH-O15-33]WNX85456.1 MBL fold metallo-hydrolase [Agathobaculum sp. NTUH-O15-33]